MTKVYLAGGISDTDRKMGQKRVAEILTEYGYDVYAAANNDSINDKSNNPTPMDIYDADVRRIIGCDVFVVRISGGNEDGTLSEIGLVAGLNEALTLDGEPVIKIVAYTTNERLLQPQFWNGIASGGFNHLVAGMIDKWGVFVGTEKDMIDYMFKEDTSDEDICEECQLSFV